MEQIEIIYPDDWHCHLRDGAYLATTVPMVAKQFKRAIVMPNLNPPVTTAELVRQYHQRIMEHVPTGSSFTPLMTLYLKDSTTPEIIKEAKQEGLLFGCKLYPAGVTTHSQAGVTQLEKLFPALETMATLQVPLLIHGEVNDPEVDIFDRERIFIEKHLTTLLKEFPTLKIVLEHITTQDAVQFIKESANNVAATITPQHLWLNRNALFSGGIQPHHYCLPVLKRKIHQQALIQAATSGNPKFFLGTDSAPHPQAQKESACGCAGIFSHHAAMEMYAHIFEQENALPLFEGFASKFGPDFYGLPYNKEKLILRKQNWDVPEKLAFGNDTLIPFLAAKTLNWQQIS